jgi:hypothetical protein
LKTNATEIVLQKNKNIMNVYNHTRFIMTLGYSSVNSNMILQPNIAVSGANPSNAHFTNSMGSIVGGTTGCGGPGGSAAALAGDPGYNIVRKGGSSKRRSHKRSLSKREKYDRKHWWMLKGGSKRSGSKRSGSKRSGSKRSKRGGLSAMSPAPFSGGVNAPYNQFTGGAPLSFNYAVGGSRTPLPLAQIGLANNNMIDIHNSCGKDYRLLGLIQGK